MVELKSSRALKKVIGYTTTVSFFSLLLSITPSYAIPSPDLVVGSISSISQLIALASAMLGGGAAVVGVRAAANSSRQTGRIAWCVIGIASVFLGLSLVGNYYQYSRQQAARQERLEAAIQRPTETSDGHTLDSDLKEASYADQLHSPRGITTDEMQRLLTEKQRGLDGNEVLLDVREDAETAMGILPGATTIRFPDLAHAHLNLAGKTAVLYCDNGNRSYETCQALAALGIDCRFMVGGLEKWFSESRPFGPAKETSLADFRSLPVYPNKDVLLDTPDVRKLVSEGAVFVDVRYPGEFSTYHLPEAVNLPIRPTVSDELRARIAALPHRPIIAPCYDRRSCFYAQILGYQVSQAGYDFKGRYTVPWDFYISLAPRPYILKYLNELHQSWWGRFVDIVASSVNKIADYSGFLIAIISLAILSRLLVLPFSLKAERDQIISKDLTDEIAELKGRLSSDPRRLARGMRAFYRRHNLTPLRNMIGLAFLPLMSVCVSAIHAVAIERDQSILWVANSATRDPTLILPLVFAALICVYLDSAFVRTLRHRILVWSIGMVVLTATGGILSAAADVYLIASAGLLLIQRAVVTKKFTGLLQWIKRQRFSNGIISLDDADRLSNCGNKAYRLAMMRAHGFSVPAGVVLTTRFLEEFSAASSQWRKRELDRVWRGLKAHKVAVRSSGSAEDGSLNSFAGVFESVLNVDRAGLDRAIKDVLASFSSGVVSAYGAAGGNANIIIQLMIEPDYSGVLFTRDPAYPTHSLVEFVEGTADKLVSGAVAPVICRIGRASTQPIGADTIPLDLKPLVAVGQQLEVIFGHPQDVEWAQAAGKFYLVQSRDITRMEHGTELELTIQNEWSRVLDRAAGAPPDETVFEQNELSEVLPRPTALSLSLMEALWASGGSIDLACRKLGFSYRVEEDSPPYLMTIFGRLYVDKREELARAPKISSLARRRVNKLSTKIENDFRSTFLPVFLKEIALLEATNFEKLSTADLLDVISRIRDNYVTSTSVAASVINIAADCYFKLAKEKLIAAGLEPARHLAHSGLTEFERALIKANNSYEERRHELLLRDIGHRSSVDYELAEPRYAERPDDLNPLLDGAIFSTEAFSQINSTAADTAANSELKRAVQVACAFQTCKEDAKHHSLRELAVLRRAILALDQRLNLNDLTFHLTFEEIKSLGEDNALASLYALAFDRRQKATQIGRSPAPGSALTVRQIEQCALGIKPQTSDQPERSAGVRVSGSGYVDGRACVVMENDTTKTAEIPDFRDGDIVISCMVPSTWIPYFKRAGGFVCEVGGWLSHTAIVAREFNVPLIVQAKGIRTIETGQSIRLHPDGTVEVTMVQPEAKAASAH
jgi:rhodanese-related sulfurtransferase/membrane protein insertase Oxa1/YidC/SpoIIIJ/phosphohistidine swiveling domain-containing protein